MLKGKTALVTGSTSGIGLGLALALVKNGANVMLNGFGEIDAAKAEVAAAATDGARVSYLGADMSQPAEIEAMVRACEGEFGAVDILVNNAGIQHVANVDCAKFRLAGPHHGLDLGRLAHVGAVVGHPRTVCGGRGHFSLGGIDLAKTIEHHVGAIFDQRQGQSQADAAG